MSELSGPLHTLAAALGAEERSDTTLDLLEHIASLFDITEDGDRVQYAFHDSGIELVFVAGTLGEVRAYTQPASAENPDHTFAPFEGSPIEGVPARASVGEVVERFGNPHEEGNDGAASWVRYGLADRWVQFTLDDDDRVRLITVTAREVPAVTEEPPAEVAAAGVAAGVAAAEAAGEVAADEVAAGEEAAEGVAAGVAAAEAASEVAAGETAAAAVGEQEPMPEMAVAPEGSVTAAYELPMPTGEFPVLTGEFATTSHEHVSAESAPEAEKPAATPGLPIGLPPWLGAMAGVRTVMSAPPAAAAEAEPAPEDAPEDSVPAAEAAESEPVASQSSGESAPEEQAAPGGGAPQDAAGTEEPPSGEMPTMGEPTAPPAYGGLPSAPQPGVPPVGPTMMLPERSPAVKVPQAGGPAGPTAPLIPPGGPAPGLARARPEPGGPVAYFLGALGADETGPQIADIIRAAPCRPQFNVSGAMAEYRFLEAGFTLYFANRVLETVYLFTQYFRDPTTGVTYRPFAGPPVGGLAPNATIEQIVHRFGPPDQVSPGQLTWALYEMGSASLLFSFDPGGRTAMVGLRTKKPSRPAG